MLLKLVFGKVTISAQECWEMAKFIIPHRAIFMVFGVQTLKEILSAEKIRVQITPK